MNFAKLVATTAAKIAKTSLWQIFVTHLHNFRIFQLYPKYLKKVPLKFLSIFPKMTKSKVENKYVAETGTWGSFGRHFGEKKTNF